MITELVEWSIAVAGSTKSPKAPYVYVNGVVAVSNKSSFLNYPRQAGQRRAQIYTFDTLIIAHGSSIRSALFALNN